MEYFVKKQVIEIKMLTLEICRQNKENQQSHWVDKIKENILRSRKGNYATIKIMIITV